MQFSFNERWGLKAIEAVEDATDLQLKCDAKKLCNGSADREAHVQQSSNQYQQVQQP